MSLVLVSVEHSVELSVDILVCVSVGVNTTVALVSALSSGLCVGEYRYCVGARINDSFNVGVSVSSR